MQAVYLFKLQVKKGQGKTGASRRGNTGCSSDGHYYWV